MGEPFQATGVGSERRKYYDVFPSCLKTFSYNPANISSFSAAMRGRRRLQSLGGEVRGRPARSPARPTSRRHLLPDLVSAAGPLNLKEDRVLPARRGSPGVNAGALGAAPRAGIDQGWGRGGGSFETISKTGSETPWALPQQEGS